MVLLFCITYLTLVIVTKNVRIDSNESTANLIKYFKFHQVQNEPESQVKFTIEESFNEVKNILEKRAQYVVQMCKQVENRTKVPPPMLSNLVVDK